VNTGEITQILSQCAMEDLRQWEKQIKEAGQVKILKEPQLGLVMMRAKDSVQQQIFNLGEVLVSECVVSVDGQQGYGVVMGNQPYRAEVMAVIDAVFHSRGAKWETLLIAINCWLEEQRKAQKREQQQEFNITGRSNVDFEIMNQPVGEQEDGE